MEKRKDYVVTDQHFAEDYYRNGARKSEMPEGWKKRPNVLKFCRKHQDLPGVVVQYGDPEYKALACWVSDDEIQVGMKMKTRVHYTYDQVFKMAGLPKDRFDKALEHALWAGMISIDTNDPEVVIDGKRQVTYRIPIFVPGIMEALCMNPELCEQYPIIPKSFSEYTIKRIIPLSTNLPIGRGVMRVLPIESAVKDDPNIHDDEKVSYYLNKAEVISVGPCSCRVCRRMMGEGCGHLEEDMCIQMDEGARHLIKMGHGRQITKEEAFEIVAKAEANGLMHEMPNIGGENHTHAICNCCGCSCFSLRCGEYFHTSTMVRSNYVSQVDPEKCVACGECVEDCPMNALRLGERLKNKEEIKIELPINYDNHRWPKERWNPDYRFDRQYIMNETGTAPCKVACPAHISIEGYIELAKEGRYDEALALIKKKNPFPAVCGRVCNKRCEDACTRGSLDQPVSIDEIKKFVAQRDLEAATRELPRIQHPEFHDHKMAVIGAGPAGLSCAYYLAEKGYSVTVFEKEEKLGGMLTLGIPSFRLEKDVVNAEIQVIKDMGVEFKTGCEVGKDVTIQQLREEGYQAFYIAIGAQGGRRLGVEGEDSKGVISGIDFLRQVNEGKDIKLHGHVALMGAGNVAMDVARTAIRMGAESVDLYCLESREIMPAAKEEIAEAEEEGIKINNGWGVKEFHHDEKGNLTEVVLKKCVAVFDKEHHFNPQYDENQTLVVPCSFFLSAIGQSFEWGNLLEGTKCVVNHGRMQADGLTYQTDEPDIFVGGDCYHGARFAIDAIATGKEGAESMHRYVHPGQSLLVGRVQNPYLQKYELDKNNIDVQGWDNTPRQEVKRIKVDDVMKDDRVVYSEEQVKAEAKRCLKCGRTFVDETMCVGCGLCVTRCKFDAIHLVRRTDVHNQLYEEIVGNSLPHIVSRNLKIVFKGKGKAKVVAKDRIEEHASKAKKDTLR